MSERGQAAELDAAQQPSAWHALAAATVLARLDAAAGGLTSAEAAARLRRHGPNRLPRRRPPTRLAIFGRQFVSPLILVLGIAACASLALGELTDAAFIAAVLVLNAAIGGFQEWRAEQGSRALARMLAARATVVRDGELRDVDAEQVVVGDVLWLESGNRVLADGRLLEERGLEVDESLLTGESLPVGKSPDELVAPATPLGDRRTMVHAGSTVVHGRAHAVVTDTGPRTVVGRLARDVAAASGGRPPLVLRMERFARVIGVVIVLAAVGVGALGVARGELSDMFLVAVALAVSAVPEGLPVAMTVALAIATQRMARRGVIVRRLAAVEGLGSCTFIASDKTGTLTRNELTATAVVMPDGRGFEATGEGRTPAGSVLRDGRPVDVADEPGLTALAHVAALCNEAELHAVDGGWRCHGDATDVALLALVGKLGLRREHLLEVHAEVNALPFEPERRFAATWNAAASSRAATRAPQADGTPGEAQAIHVKGAPERVLSLCSSALGDVELSEALERAHELAASGHRVLAFARGVQRQPLRRGDVPPTPSELELVGFVGMIDPLREGAREAVASCRRAGVEVAMVTGDHPVTALAIARQLGLAASPEQVVTGEQLTALAATAGTDPAPLRELVRRVRVFARVEPRQKLEIVEAARAAGHFVAVTGDGVNDAPALRAANVGVAMGRSGTDVAREAAELVIVDDELGTIVAGIEEGRIAYDNVRKVIYLLVSTGAAEIVLLALSLAAGLPIPLLPAQILWLNLVTNGIQDVALAFEAGEGDALHRPPRPPRERIFNRLMVERTLVAAVVMGLVAFGAWSFLLDRGWDVGPARNATLLLMVLFENVHLGNCRSETRSLLALSPLRSPWLLGAALLALAVHVAAMHLPIGHAVLGVEPISVRAGATLVVLALSVTAAMEAHSAWWRRRHRA